MDISALRFQLQQKIPDLQLLTTAELTSCKWAVVKKIIIPLIEVCPSLRTFSEELGILLEVRQQEVAQLRKAEEGRDRRLESEVTFRTSFMRILIGALTHLRWPPALEPFSDPMDGLMNDSATMHSAIYHILEYGVPKDANRFSRSSLDARPHGDPTDRPRSEAMSVQSSPSLDITANTPRVASSSVGSSRRRSSAQPQVAAPTTAMETETSQNMSFDNSNHRCDNRTPNVYPELDNSRLTTSTSTSALASPPNRGGVSSSYHTYADECNSGSIPSNTRKTIEVCCMLCMLYAVRCMLYAVCCMLYAVCCMLHAVCCMLYAVCCMLTETRKFFTHANHIFKQ
jgi:hypothetical protein